MQLTAPQARDRFAAEPVARLATVSEDGAPHLVPVTFALLTESTESTELTGATGVDRLVVAVDHKPKTTTRLRRLGNVRAEPRVCFVADYYTSDWTRLWWARADATATVLESDSDDRLRKSALDALSAKYPQYREVRPSGPVIVATVTRWSGWAHR